MNYICNLAFAGFIASSASPSNQAPNSFASDDFQLYSASMSRDSGTQVYNLPSLLFLFYCHFTARFNWLSNIYQMVSECKDQSGHLCGVPPVWSGHVLLSDQEPLLHQILKRQQLSVRPRRRHSAPRQRDGVRYEERGEYLRQYSFIHLVRTLHCICYQQPGLVQLQRCECEGDWLSECAELQGLHPVLRPEGLQQSHEQLSREEDGAEHWWGFSWVSFSLNDYYTFSPCLLEWSSHY